MSKRKSLSQYPNRIQQCVFCGQVPLTKEHFWPSWMKEAIPQSKYNQHLRVESDGKKKIRYFSEGVQKKITGPPGSWQQKVVCSVCNNGWMSQIETEAKPILTALAFGESVEIKKKEQIILSKWAFLKVIIGEFNEVPKRYITREERHFFFKYKTVPSEWRIWIARLKPAMWGYLYYQTGNNQSYGETVSGNQFIHRSKEALFTLGEMVMYVGKYSFREFVVPVPQIEFCIVGEHQRKMNMIQPVTHKTINWSSVECLDHSELLELNNNLRSFTEILTEINRRYQD